MYSDPWSDSFIHDYPLNKVYQQKNENKHTNGVLKSVFLGMNQKLNIFFFHCSGAITGAPNVNIVQNHLNIALLNVF